MFIAVLFTTAKVWKLLFTDGWRNKEVIVYMQWNIIQPIKKNKILPSIATWMDLGGNDAKWNKPDKKDKYLLYVESKKEKITSL